MGPPDREGDQRVTELPVPTANRLPHARWLDARLLAGLLLVLLSVVLGAKLVADADERVRVWSLTRDLGADVPLTEDDVDVAAVRLDGTASRYVSAEQDLDGLVLTRPVGRGELLPVAAVGRAGALTQRRLVIEVDRLGVVGLTKGRVVDLYVVREVTSAKSPAPPELVLANVTVAEDVRSGASAFGGSGAKAGVSLLVDQADVPGVIDAVANGSVYVVQVPASAPSPEAAGS